MFHDGAMLIGGKLVTSESDQWIESIDPATEEVIGRVPAGTATDIDQAVGAAHSAFPRWAELPGTERAACLRQLGTTILQHRDELLDLDVRDSGNTISKAVSDIDRTAQALDYYAGLAYETKGESVPASPGGVHFSVRRPFGVVGRIVPFNHPLQFAASKLAAPLAAGNTVVVKPSEQSPLSAARLGELCQEIFPPGVVNIVTGYGRDAGDALVRHPSVRRLAFIGSVPTGLAIQRTAAETAVKHVSLELGGKNPFIVFPDVELEPTIDAAVAGMNFSWQGQSCGSTSRLFLHRSLYDAGVEMLRDKLARIRQGSPSDWSSQMGPVNSRAQYEKDLAYIESARSENARLVFGGARPPGEQFEKGFWLQPTAFCDVDPTMRIFREEIFGPVLSVIPWSNQDEVIDMANSVEYGLTAAVWTNDLKNAMTTALRVDAGYVWINGTSAHFLGTSFGGVKNSGLGREEGVEELLSYTEEKSIHLMLGG